jgi:RNA-directed DNA polymerase
MTTTRLTKRKLSLVHRLKCNQFIMGGLISCSFAAKFLAVKRVTENKGKKTPGIDGARWLTPAAKYKAIFCLKRKGYKAQPLRRIYYGWPDKFLSIGVYTNTDI